MKGLELREGQTILHPTLGEGIVLSAEPNHVGAQVAWIDFGGAEPRKILPSLIDLELLPGATPTDPAAAERPDPGLRLEKLRAALVDSKGLDDIPPPEPLLDGILFRDSLAWIHGKPGHGKSFVALDWAGCIATRTPWQIHEVAVGGSVLYLAAEGVSGLRQRVRAWEDAHHQDMTGVDFLPVAVQLLSVLEREALVALLAELRPALVVIDTQARVTVGAEENSAKDMGELVSAVDEIRRATAACVLVVHHESRAGENMRGSTALEGAATTIVRVTKDGPHVRVDCTKQKDCEPFDPLLLRLSPHADSAVLQSQNGVGLTEELTKSEQIILQAMRDSFGTTGASGGTLRDLVALPKTSYYRAINLLVRRGDLHNTGTDKRPFYVLPGEALLP